MKSNGLLRDQVAKQEINALKDYSLTDTDMDKVLDPDTHIFTYPDLYKFNHVDELFDHKGRAIMLYLTTDENTGHWVGLLKRGNTIEMYDPYGYKPDTQPKKLGASKEFNKEHNQLYPKFTEMVKKDGYKLIWNKKGRQPHRENVDTCGRHVLMRLMHHNLTLGEYDKLMDKIKSDDNVDVDDLVTAFTNAFLDK